MTLESLTLLPEEKENMLRFFNKAKEDDLLTSYLHFMAMHEGITPVLLIKKKIIFKTQEEAVQYARDKGILCHETVLHIQQGSPDVDEETRKIYICPFSGKVFGDNTHPHPQDAIYDWVANCPENNEWKGGVKSKRFLTSEDPSLIDNYREERKEAIERRVFSSGVTGTLFNSAEAVYEDFITHQIKPMAFEKVPTQNRFLIEESFMEWIQEILSEERVGEFVEAMRKEGEFAEQVAAWEADEE
ncbi:MAG: DUF2709 domain-containing protein [Chlamydiota bacterium]|nr:DUF2709 domain-containing protein [Chlamydiota bacterium]